MDHLRIFHDVARTLTTSLELEEILLAIMEKMANFFGPERWSLLMVDADTEELYYAIALGEDLESLKGLRIPMGEGVAGWVAATGNPLIVPNVSLDPHWAAFARKHTDLNIQSIACLPIRSENRTLGVIQLLNSKMDLLSEFSVSFLRILCDYAAIAIRNARSRRRIQQLSITDDCTGLFNSRHLYNMLEEQIALGGPLRKVPFSLLFLDLDHFKNVNDTHGHLYVTIGLCNHLRQSRFLESDGLSLSILGSFGLATFPEDGDTVSAILRSADSMMYEAKNATRNNVAVAGLGLVMDMPPAELSNELKFPEVRRVASA